MAVSNKALITKDGSYGMLKTWVDSVKKAGVTNYMVVCLDDEVRRTADRHIRNKAPVSQATRCYINIACPGYETCCCHAGATNGAPPV